MRFTFKAMSCQVAANPCAGKNKFLFLTGWAKFYLGWKKNTLLQALVRGLACSGLQECIFCGLGNLSLKAEFEFAL